MNEAGAPPSPDVSVCICTYQRRESLLETLRSLEAADVPEGLAWEVLVVDNNSEDGTAEAVERFRRSTTLPLRHVIETRQGLSHARNRAVEETSGRVVAFLDDDVRVAPDWLEALVGAFGADGRAPAAVGGRALLPSDLPRPDWWHERFAGKVGHFDRGAEVRTSEEGYGGMIGIGANLAFRRDALERYGSFRPDLGRAGDRLGMGEELELLDRLRADGELLVYDPRVVVEHRPDLDRFSRSYLRRWYFQFGLWAFEKEREADVARILGVPRWRFRHAAEEAFRSVRARVTGRRGESLLHRLNVVAFAGYLTGAWARGRS